MALNLDALFHSGGRIGGWIPVVENICNQISIYIIINIKIHNILNLIEIKQHKIRMKLNTKKKKKKKAIIPPGG